MRILLADDQPRVRFALRVLLERQAGLEIAGEVGDAMGLLEEVKARCPDVVLVDWELPGMCMEDLMPAIRNVCPQLIVIALSGRLDVRRPALDAGADTFVCKCDSPERLLAEIAAHSEKTRSIEDQAAEEWE